MFILLVNKDAEDLFSAFIVVGQQRERLQAPWKLPKCIHLLIRPAEWDVIVLQAREGLDKLKTIFYKPSILSTSSEKTANRCHVAGFDK